jgi:pyridoxamine 5'-phosphate oxidase
VSPDRRPPEDLPTPLPAEPLALVAEWLATAAAERVQPHPDAMVLATADAAGRPSARVVLCKGCVPDPGFLVFCTDYGSRKARELDERPEAAGVFHWDRRARQVRVEGRITRSPPAESDEQYAARAVPSRIAVWGSRQSRRVAERTDLIAAVTKTAAGFGVDWSVEGRLPEPAEPLPRPGYWGGYRLWPERVELWVEGSSRLHDRALWSRTLTPTDDGFRGGRWRVTRLAP